MKTVPKHIKSLLFTNDCVIIPDFGGLVSNPHSATFNKLSQHFSPPYKALGFNTRLKNSDGLLAHEVSIKDNVDYNEASKAIQAFVNKLKDDLSTSNQFVLDEIGTFYNDVNGNLRFKQNTKLPLDTNFFGLESIRSLPIEIKKDTPTVQQIITESKKEAETPVISIAAEIKEEEKIFPWKRLAIAACLIPFIFYLFWISTSTSLLKGNDQFQYSDLNPFSEKVCDTFNPRDKDATLVQIPAESISTLELIAEIGNENYVDHSFLETTDKELHSKDFIPVRLHNFKAVAFSTAVSGDKNLFAPRNKHGFYIITGCFGFYENATKYVSSLRSKGLEAQIVDQKNGLFRISASSAKNRAEALRELDTIKSSGFKDAWVLSK